MLMRYLTEPAPYTGQVLSPAVAHSVAVMGHILSSPHAIQCPWIVSFQFVTLMLLNYNIHRMSTRFDSGTEFAHVLYNVSAVTF